MQVVHRLRLCKALLVEFSWRGTQFSAQLLKQLRELAQSPYRNVRIEVGSCLHLSVVGMHWHMVAEQRAVDDGRRPVLSSGTTSLFDQSIP